MKEILPGIFQSHIDKPFYSGLSTVSYLAERPGGNLLFYSNNNVEKDFDFIKKKGPVLFQILAHRHEAGLCCEKVKTRLAASLACHELESEFVEKYTSVDHKFSGQSKLLNDLEVIPTPGPTDGSCCFLLHHKSGNILFTGDTLFPVHDEWTYGVGNEQKNRLLQSLEKLVDLDVDVIVPAIFIGDKQFESFPRLKDYKYIIRDCMAKLRMSPIT